MKRLISASLVGCLSLILTGALAGCHASVDTDRTTSGSSTEKKTTVRDANGNIVHQDVEKSTTNNP